MPWGPFRFYAHHLGDYMRRWFFTHPWGAIRIHNIQRADFDPDMHDHPWNFGSFVLWGWYIEELPGPTLRTRSMFSFAYHRAEGRHRIVSVSPSLYTLVFTGPKIRDWGFHTPHGFVPWKSYVFGRDGFI